MIATPIVANYGPSNFLGRAILKTECQTESNQVKVLNKKFGVSIRWNCYCWKCPPPLLRSQGSDHIFIVGLRRATFYKDDRILRQFQYEQGMPSGKGRKPFTPVDTNPTSIRNVLLGLDMADQVDQSFVKVHFHRMTMEYSNWIVNKIVDKEVNMVAMRKQFLKDNQDKHEANNYEFKRRDKDDKVPTIDGINEQPKEKRLEKEKKESLIIIIIFFVWL